jgi:hypothetical protein
MLVKRWPESYPNVQFPPFSPETLVRLPTPSYPYVTVRPAESLTDETRPVEL